MSKLLIIVISLVLGVLFAVVFFSIADVLLGINFVGGHPFEICRTPIPSCVEGICPLATRSEECNISFSKISIELFFVALFGMMSYFLLSKFNKKIK